ncbi:MAG: hypothetical protein WCI06_07695 [Methylococcaceae bacterium]
MKNMKKVFTGVAIAVALSTSASVFADSSAKLSAFNGVPSEAVSQAELNVVSGEGALSSFIQQLLKLSPSERERWLHLKPLCCKPPPNQSKDKYKR